MIAVQQQPTCRNHAHLLGPYLDGELEPATLLDVEQHVETCVPCREHIELLRASRASLKRVVRTVAPLGLRSRIGSAMVAEKARGQSVRDQEQARVASKLGGWKTMVPLATAAALALFFGGANRATTARPEAHAGFGDDLLQDLVAEHSQPLPVEATNERAVRNLEKYVGVPVRPARFERNGAKLVGARVLPIHQERAAMLQYVVTNDGETRRVSVFVYNPEKIRVSDADLTPRAIGTAHVQVGMARGYSVALAERGGVAYAFASDKDAAQLAALVYADDQ